MNHSRYISRIFILALTYFVSAAAVFADTPQVTMTFDRKSVAINGEINLTIKIIGAEGALQRPRLPATDSFTTYYSGRSSETRQQGGQTGTVAEFNFILVPKAVGKFTFPAVEVEIGDQVYQTASIDLEVFDVPGAAKPSPAAIDEPPPSDNDTSTYPPSGPVDPASQIPHTPPSNFIPPGADSDIFLKAWIDKTTAFPNEQILLTYSIYTRLDTQYEGFEEEPVITGFWLESFANPAKLEKTVVSIGGERFVKVDIRKMALFPQGDGRYVITPGSVKVSVEEHAGRRSMFDEFFDDSFFSNRLFAKKIPKILGTDPITITVKPFPSKNKPNDFTGAVGRFTLSADIDQRSVKQNEPVTLSLVVEGDGNIETLERPTLPEAPDFQVYDADVSTTMLKRQDKVQGRKTFEVTFIPTESGTLEIPPAKMVYFDPVALAYKTLQSPSFQINVAPGDPSDQPPPEPRKSQEKPKGGVEIEARDIFFIREEIKQLPWERTYPLLDGWLLMNGGLTIFLLLTLVYRRYQDKLDTNVALKRRKLAPRDMRRGFGELRKAMKDESAEGHARFCSVAQKTLLNFVAAHKNVSMKALTRQDVESEIKKRDPDGATLEKLNRFYNTCNRVIFMKGELNHDERKAVVEDMEDIIRVLEKKK